MDTLERLDDSKWLYPQQPNCQAYFLMQKQYTMFLGLDVRAGICNNKTHTTIAALRTTESLSREEPLYPRMAQNK